MSLTSNHKKITEEFTPSPVMGLHQGRDHYYRNIKDGDSFTQKQISSFIIIPKQRVWLGGKEVLTVDFVSPRGTTPDVVIRRRDWNTTCRFMNTLVGIDQQWFGEFADIRCVQGLVAQYKIPEKAKNCYTGKKPTIRDFEAILERHRASKSSRHSLPRDRNR